MCLFLFPLPALHRDSSLQFCVVAQQVQESYVWVTPAWGHPDGWVLGGDPSPTWPPTERSLLSNCLLPAIMYCWGQTLSRRRHTALKPSRRVLEISSWLWAFSCSASGSPSHLMKSLEVSGEKPAIPLQILRDCLEAIVCPWLHWKHSKFRI